MGRRTHAYEELFRCLTGNLRSPGDWGSVLQLASDTLTIGTFASKVLGSDLEQDLPDNVRDLLVTVLERTKERNKRQLAQLSELLPPLNAAGANPMVMRGMATLIQGRDEGRLMSDIDLLIPASCRNPAIEILRSSGYTIFQGFHGPPYPVTLGRPQDVGMIDLHTDIQPYNLRVNFERLAPLCRRIQLDGGWVLVPTPTCSLLLYILHDQLHDGDYWRGLIDARHMADIPQLVEEGVDWRTLEGFFPPGVARNAMAVQLRTAKSLMRIDIPERYCGGAWAKVQSSRRHLQLRFPWLRYAFTLFTVALDPPRELDPPKKSGKTGRRERSVGRRMTSKLQRTMSTPNPGKIQLR